MKVAIHGFGRIGRMVLQAMVDQGLLGKEIEVAAVVDVSTNADYFAYPLKYDTVHGRMNAEISSEKSDASLAEDDILVVNGNKIKCLGVAKELKDLPWKAMGVEYVIESTGLFTASEKAQGHLDAGAKKVIISAPGKGDVKTALVDDIAFVGIFRHQVQRCAGAFFTVHYSPVYAGLPAVLRQQCAVQII